MQHTIISNVTISNTNLCDWTDGIEAVFSLERTTRISVRGLIIIHKLCQDVKLDGVSSQCLKFLRF